MSVETKKKIKSTKIPTKTEANNDRFPIADDILATNCSAKPKSVFSRDVIQGRLHMLI